MRIAQIETDKATVMIYVSPSAFKPYSDAGELRFGLDPDADFSTQRTGSNPIQVEYSPRGNSGKVAGHYGEFPVLTEPTFSRGEKVSYFMNYRAKGAVGGWQQIERVGIVQHRNGKWVKVLNLELKRFENVPAERITKL